jgi:hypothetical protein
MPAIDELSVLVTGGAMLSEAQVPSKGRHAKEKR